MVIKPASPGEEAPGDPATPSLAVSVLGELTASLAGQELDLGGRRQRAVLALLVLARGDAVTAGSLIDSVWGTDPPANAAATLQSYISHLRRRLEPQHGARDRGNVIVRRGPGYAFVADPRVVDAWRFERMVTAAARDAARAVGLLTSALALWRGPAFADYADEPWVQAEAARLTELRAVAREQLLAARLASGESAIVVPEAEALVAEDPLREERWRLLVLSLYRAQRQGEALATLRRARQTLADELGVDPGPALRELEAEVRAQSPTLDAPRPSVPAKAIPTPRPPSARPDPLVDRDRELRQLHDSLTAAFAGQAGLIVVEGPAGIGKTRLLTEVRRMAAELGALTCSSGGSQLEREFGFGVVRQLFEAVVADQARTAAAFAGPAASAAAVFDVADADRMPRAEGGLAALHGLYWLTANLTAEQPLVLCVDDLQWCDSGSLRFLAYLARRLDGLPLLVLATLRTGEPHRDEDLLAEIVHDPLTVRMRPNPLTPAGVTELVRQWLGPAAEDAFIAACHRTTAGNPLLLRQLLHALRSEGVRPNAAHADTVTAIGSRAISSMVLRRLARMDPTATTTAQAVAVLGNGAPLPAVAALAELPEQVAVTAIAALARAEVLRDDYPLAFVHPLVADAVYRDLAPGMRQLHHERAARVLQAAGAPAEQIAAHLLQVPERGDPWLVQVLATAADRAMDRGAVDAAATYLARALSEPPSQPDKPRLLLELGRVETHTDGFAAVAHLREAYDTLEDAVLRAEAAELLTRTLVFLGRQGEPVTFARQAAQEISPDLVDRRQALLGLESIAGYMHGVAPLVWLDGARPAVVGQAIGARMLASALAWDAVIVGTDREAAIDLARFAIDGRALIEHDTGLLGVVAAATLNVAEGDAGTFWDDALAWAHERGSMFDALAVHLWRGFDVWQRGDLREALQSLLTSAEQQNRWGNSVGLAYTHAFITGVYLDMGEVAQARSYLEQTRGLPRMGDGARLIAQAEADLLLAEGRFAEAVVLADRARSLNPVAANPAWFRWRSLRARALAGLGELESALTLMRQEVELAHRWGTRAAIGQALRLRGELLFDPAAQRHDRADTQRLTESLADLRESVRQLAGSSCRLEHARALAALGSRLAPRTPERIESLREAIALAERGGAAGLRQTIAQRLAESGIVVPAQPDVAVTLTTTERRIAALAASGHDDREIAQQLFLTPRSVGDTLESLRRRLAVSTLDELRAALGPN